MSKLQFKINERVLNYLNEVIRMEYLAINQMFI